MLNKTPYSIVKSRYTTEKSRVLENLQNNSSNACVKKCNAPKYVFLVAKTATKQQIAQAVEQIYAEKDIKVVAVNTINVKPRVRRVRGRVGETSAFKKAVVTLKAGDKLEELGAK